MCGRREDRQTETARNRKSRRERQTEQRVGGGGAESETHKDKADRKLAGPVRKGQRDRHSEQREKRSHQQKRSDEERQTGQTSLPSYFTNILLRQKKNWAERERE